MKKNWIIIFLIIVIIFLNYCLFKSNNTTISDSTEYIEKIDSLESEIDSLNNIRNDILERVDTIYVKLNNINSEHEKNVSIIVNNDIDEDYSFFLEYIRNNKSRLDSMYNIK
jgi:outer membrane lipoprotein-sorting protein